MSPDRDESETGSDTTVVPSNDPEYERLLEVDEVVNVGLFHHGSIVGDKSSDAARETNQVFASDPNSEQDANISQSENKAQGAQVEWSNGQDGVLAKEEQDFARDDRKFAPRFAYNYAEMEDFQKEIEEWFAYEKNKLFKHIKSQYLAMHDKGA